MIPFGDFAPDLADQNQNVATVADNCIPVGSHYGPLKDVGAAVYSPNFVVDGMNGIELIDNESSANTRYYINGAKGEWAVNGSDFNKAGLGSKIHVTYGNPFVVWEDQLLLAGGGVDPPQKITITDLSDSGVTKSTDIGGSPPVANTCTRVRDFVVVGGLYEDGGYLFNRLRWSGSSQFEQWTAGTNQSDFNDMKDNTAIEAIVGGEYGIVFQRNSISRMSYVGTPAIFSFDEIEGAKGTPAGKSVVRVGSDIYYLSFDGFQVLRNGSRSDPISQKLNRWFFDELGHSSLTDLNDVFHGIQGAYDRRNNLIFWTYSRFDNSNFNSNSPVNNRMLIFSIDTGRFTSASLDNVLGVFPIENRFVASGDDYVIEDFSIGVIKQASDSIHFLNGSALAASLETGEVSDEGYLSTLKSVRPIVDGTTTVIASTRDLLTETPTDTSSVTPDASGKANFRTHARYHRIKVNTYGDFNKAIGVEADVVRRGKR